MTADSVMFEILRDEPAAGGRFRVLYYTELDEHERDIEIQRALTGESVYDGYLAGPTILHAKIRIERWLARLNGGETFDRAGFEQDLRAHLTP